MMSFDERILNGTTVLAAVVRNGSFVGAGKALNLSQSGVSRSIARLEGRLGIRLLDRTTRSVTITDEGRRFYEQVAPLLNALEDVAASVMEARPEFAVEVIARDQLGDLVSEGFDVAIHRAEPPLSGLVAKKLWDTRIIT